MDFLDTINEWIENVETNIEDVLQTVTFMIGKELVVISPVDTGLFRGNWQMTIGGVSTHSLIRYDTTGAQSISDMQRTVRTFTPGQVAYIQNNLTYGYDLEYGSSMQAPNGMVRITEARFRLILEQAVLLNPM